MRRPERLSRRVDIPWLFCVAALCLAAACAVFTPVPAAVVSGESMVPESGGRKMQHGHGMGWKPTPPGEYRNFRRYQPSFAAAAAASPVDLSSQLPPVGDQGSQSSCVAWSVGYYYKTWQEGREHRWNPDDARYQFSPAFVYNQREDHLVDDGMTFQDAFGILEGMGSVNIAEMPYDPMDYTTQPTASQKQAALPYRIEDDWSYF